MAAPPEEVWAVVADVTRVGEWSGECQGCSWVDADSAVPGAEFRGRNRRDGLRWTRRNEMLKVDRPRELTWRTLPLGVYPDTVEWRILLEPDGRGTKVTESFRVKKLPRVMEWLIDRVFPAHRDRSADLARDLRRLKTLVETGTQAGS